MTEVFDYHRLFQNPTETAFIRRLDLDPRTIKVLDEAEEAIRGRLRPSLKALAERFGVKAPYSTPRFRRQGSSVYRTQNLPAHPPLQQVDVDLGVYLSASFMENVADASQRKLPSSALAKLYFEIVDRELRALCREKGWEYADGEKQNDRCCRVILTNTGADAHIDLPLYAAPDAEFERAFIAEMLALEALAKSARDSADLSKELDREGWDELELIVLATRDGKWTESDVQKTIQHFRTVADATGHPNVLRRIWRFVKAWRDFTWQTGGPSSILLMEIVQRICLDTDSQEDLLGAGRDDRILRHIFSQLPAYLQRDMLVQWGRNPEDLNRASVETRRAWSHAASVAAANLNRAAVDNGLLIPQVISLVRTVFGRRIPDDVTLVKMPRAVSLATAVVAAPAAVVQPAPRIQRTTGA